MNSTTHTFHDLKGRQPAEWDRHAATWLAWPSQQGLWLENLEPAQKEFTSLCESIAGWNAATRTADGEPLEILTHDSQARTVAQAALGHLPARFHLIPLGDIWVRDTGPIFVRTPARKVVAAQFAFNGWGGKYQLDHDGEVSERIAIASQKPQRRFSWVLEGGSVEVDGEGTCLTTRQCLLNPNRNPAYSQADIENKLDDALGIKKVLWLDRGLLHDHTDGHIDTLARFVSPGKVVCMLPEDPQDPNREALHHIHKTLVGFTDAAGRKLEVITVPSPGKLLDKDGRALPASYVNFYIANASVVVPTYGCAYDERAVAGIAQCFPGRRTVGLSSRAILAGGGAFHCITQQQPEEI